MKPGITKHPPGLFTTRIQRILGVAPTHAQRNQPVLLILILVLLIICNGAKTHFPPHPCTGLIWLVVLPFEWL